MPKDISDWTGNREWSTNVWTTRTPHVDVSVEPHERKPGSVSTRTVTAASTTDTMDHVEQAAGYDRNGYTPTPDDVVYTEACSVTRGDGTTEHGPCRTYVNGRLMTTEPPADDAVAPVLTQQVLDNFNAQKQAVRQVLSDFDETLSENVPIPHSAYEAILALPNGAMVAYHLGKHPQEAEELLGLSDGQARRRIIDLSTRLALNTVGGVAADSLPYSAYRKLRDSGRKY